jgi:hypothetical protein
MADGMRFILSFFCTVSHISDISHAFNTFSFSGKIHGWIFYGLVIMTKQMPLSCLMLLKKYEHNVNCQYQTKAILKVRLTFSK